MGKKLKILREFAGLSQYQLSAETGIDRTRLSLIENGHIVPSINEQTAIGGVLLSVIRLHAEQLNAILNGGGK